VDWQSYIEAQADYAPYRINFSDKPEEDDFIGNISSKEGGLKEHLSMQINLLGLAEIDLRLGEFIVGNIGEDGYLRLLDRTHIDDAESRPRSQPRFPGSQASRKRTPSGS
jgi:DNA-directed RNA polymerase specialized sigma54-like protein